MNDPSSLPTSPPAAPTLKDLLASRRLSLAQLIWLAVCVLTCAALLRWTMHDFPLTQVWQGFRMAHPVWLAFTLVGFVSGQLLRWLRWQRLLSYDVPAPLRDVGKSLMDGQPMGHGGRSWSVPWLQCLRDSLPGGEQHSSRGQGDDHARA